MANKDLTTDEIAKELTDAPEAEQDFDFGIEPTEENTAPDTADESPAAESLADDSTPAAVDGNGSTGALPPEGTTSDFEGIQGDVHESPENENPDEESKKAVEPASLENPLSSDENESQGKEAKEQPHISSSGNKVFVEEEALPPTGQIHQANTTAAYIEIVQPRIPGLEAMLRASATESGLADGSIKPEDAPGYKVPEGGINPESGGKPENGNSITDASKPSEDWAINPNSPTQVGDTKETAAAASAAKVENGDATSGDIEEGKTTLQSSSSGFSPMEFVQGKPENLQEKY